MLQPGKDAVYFLSLSVENVRCFAERVTLDLSDGQGNPQQWNVLLGDNGVGKTTLLQCLALMAPVRSRDSDGVIRYYTNTAIESNLGLHRVRSSRLSGSGNKARLTATVKGTSRHEAIHNVHQLSDRSTFAASHVYQPGTSELSHMRVRGYGAARYIEPARLRGREPRDASASLLSPETGLLDPHEWLLQLDYFAKSNPDGPFQSQLERVKHTLCELLPDVSDITIRKPAGDRSPTSRDLEHLVEFHTPYGAVPLERLSLGYQAMLAWVVDFASHMFERYPDSDAPLAESAVVLVDELDLHLHPRWQQRVIAHLTALFPKTQFIVTAHSPLVVQAAENANIALLRRATEHGGDHVIIENHPQEVYGWRVDQVLTSDLFGLPSGRPPRIAELMAERSRIVASESLDARSHARLVQIDEQLDRLPAGESRETRSALQEIRDVTALLKKQLEGNA